MGILDGFSVIGDITTVAEGGNPPSWYKAYDDDFPGGFSVSLGSNIAAFIYGGRQTHIFGDEIKFVIDYETLAADLIGDVFSANLGSLLSNPILAGVGGNITMGVGTNASCAYFGPKYAVDRLSGPIIKVPIDKGFFGSNWRELKPSMLSPSNLSGVQGGAAPDVVKAVNAATGMMVLILLVLMCAVALVLELLAVKKYPNLLKSKSEYDLAVVDLIRDLDITLTSRIMAAILEVEKIAAVGNGGANAAANAAHTGKTLMQALQNAVWTPAVKATLTKVANLGADTAEEATARWIIFLALLGMFGSMIGIVIYEAVKATT